MRFPIYEPPHVKTNKMTMRPAKTQISLGIRPVWSVLAVCMTNAFGGELPIAYIERTAKTLIRLGGCPGWSVFAGRTVILLVLSWGDSICVYAIKFREIRTLRTPMINCSLQILLHVA